LAQTSIDRIVQESCSDHRCSRNDKSVAVGFMTEFHGFIGRVYTVLPRTTGVEGL